MKTEEKLLRRDLAAFVEKMGKDGIDITAIKKPIDMGVSISRIRLNPSYHKRGRLSYETLIQEK